MDRFNNIGELLHEYRDKQELSQAEFSEMLDVEPRTYREWENGFIHLVYKNILRICDITKIPIQVLFRLNYLYPTYYDLKTNHYQLCPFDRDYVSRNVLQKQLFDNEEKGRLYPLLKKFSLDEITKFKGVFYPYSKRIDNKVIAKACETIPDLNCVCFDHAGFCTGHMITIPIKMEYYEHLKRKKIHEYEIKPEHLVSNISDSPVALHVYSFFASYSTFAYYLVKRLFECILILQESSAIDNNSIISRFAFTNESKELCDKLEMKIIFKGWDFSEEPTFEFDPLFYEIKIKEMIYLENYKSAINS